MKTARKQRPPVSRPRDGEGVLRSHNGDRRRSQLGASKRRLSLVDAIQERLEHASGRKWRVEEAQECVYVARCYGRDEMIVVDAFHLTYEETIDRMFEKWVQSSPGRLMTYAVRMGLAVV